MSYIKNVVDSERKRLLSALSKYKNDLKVLPVGSLVKRKKGDNIYYYLNTRVGNKVYSKYLGKNGNNINELNIKIEKRKHIKKMINVITSELNIANKILESKV